MSKKFTPALPGGRFLEIDFIRGFMLLCMAIDHGTSMTRAMGRHAASPITISQLLPSTTAEIFFLLSGYLYGHTRIATNKENYLSFTRDAYLRAFHLYAFNVLTFMIIVLLIPWFGSDLLSASRFDSLKYDGISAIRDFMFLNKAPFGLDVLQIYIIFFVFAPIFAIIVIWNKLIAVLWLICCWLAMQIWNATIGLEHDETIAINMVAWQITFFGGIALGAYRTWGPIAAYIVRARALTRTCGVLLVVIAIAWIGQKYPHRYGFAEAPWTLPMVDRATLAPVKLLSSICVLIVMIAITDHMRPTETRYGRLIILLGQRSLACFCASNVGIFFVAIIWQESGSNLIFWIAEIGLAVGVILWVAFVDWMTPSKKLPKLEADQITKMPSQNEKISAPARSITISSHPYADPR